MIKWLLPLIIPFWAVASTWNIPLSQIASEHLQTMTPEELDRDWKLTDFFGTIVVINLPESTARLEKIKVELRNIGVTDFQIFSAINGRKDVPREIWGKFYYNTHKADTSTAEGKKSLERTHQGQAGCYLSHYKIIQQTKDSFDKALRRLKKALVEKDKEKIRLAKKAVQRSSRVLILEDDSGFGHLVEGGGVSYRGVGQYLRQAFQNLPNNWDILYFFAHATEPTVKIAPHLRKMGTSWCLNGYAIQYPMYRSIMELLKKIEDPQVTYILPVDTEIATLHSSHNVYAIYPSVMYVQPGPSTISEGIREFWQGQPIFPWPPIEGEVDSD